MQAEPGELAGCRRPPLAPGPPPRAVLGERGAERELGPLPASKERKTLVPTSPHSLMGQERGRPCGRATRGGRGERCRPCCWPSGPLPERGAPPLPCLCTAKLEERAGRGSLAPTTGQQGREGPGDDTGLALEPPGTPQAPGSNEEARSKAEET